MKKRLKLRPNELENLDFKGTKVLSKFYGVYAYYKVKGTINYEGKVFACEGTVPLPKDSFMNLTKESVFDYFRKEVDPKDLDLLENYLTGKVEAWQLILNKLVASSVPRADLRISELSNSDNGSQLTSTELLQILEEWLEGYLLSFEVIEVDSGNLLDTLKNSIDGLVDTEWRDSEGTKFFFSLSRLYHPKAIRILADYVRENRLRGKPSTRYPVFDLETVEGLRKLL